MVPATEHLPGHVYRRFTAKRPRWRASFHYLSSTMRSMRRSGSAAPHSSWSPIVKALM